MKKAVIVGILILALGLVVSGISFALMGFSFNSFAKEKYESVTTEIGTEFTAIDIRGNTENIRLCRIDQNFPETRTPRVVCSENSWLKHTVTVENDTLTIRSVDTRKWYDHIGISVSGKPEIVLYLPSIPYILNIESDTGDVEIIGSFLWSDVSIRTDTGDVYALDTIGVNISAQTSTGDIRWAYQEAPPIDRKAFNVLGDMSFTTSTGHIRAENVCCQGSVFIHVSTGKTQLDDFTCANLETTGSTGDITLKNTAIQGSLNIQRSTGDVKFEDSDAAVIHIETDTGDVTGTLLSPKVFFTETDTGKVQVPRSVTGGGCEITTSTGDIKLEITE